ncbi:MAG: hypothetical protein RR177_05650, partial [Oscillospiraceae bacterium]
LAGGGINNLLLFADALFGIRKSLRIAGRTVRFCRFQTHFISDNFVFMGKNFFGYKCNFETFYDAMEIYCQKSS